MTTRREFADFDFYNHCTARCGKDMASYARFEPAYRLGYELAINNTHHNKDWLAVEMFAGRAWKAMYPDTPWADYKEAVRFAWSWVGQQLAKPI